MAIKKRNVKGGKIQDPSIIANMQFNEKAGAQKQVEVGAKLIPIPTPTSGTCDATTAIAIPAGKNLAIYNNSGTLGVVAFGNTAAELAVMPAAGVVMTNGQAGIPCKPNDWTYVASGEQTFVRTSANTLLVFLIDDDSSISTQQA